MKQEKLEKITEDNKCIWKVILDNPKSTTAEDIRRSIDPNPLRYCLEHCDGNSNLCADYRRSAKYKK